MWLIQRSHRLNSSMFTERELIWKFMAVSSGPIEVTPWNMERVLIRKDGFGVVLGTCAPGREALIVDFSEIGTPRNFPLLRDLWVSVTQFALLWNHQSEELLARWFPTWPLMKKSRPDGPNI